MLLTLFSATALVPPASRALSQAWKQPLNDLLGSNEVDGTSSLGNVEISRTETRIAASLLLGTMKCSLLTSQTQSQVPCWESTMLGGMGEEGKGKQE